MSRRSAQILVASLLMATTATAFHRVPRSSSAERGEVFVPRPEVARATALGFDAILADYYWLQAVQVVGGAIDPFDHGTLLGRLIDVVTTLNPRVDHPYRFAAVWLVASEEEVRTANRLLERGIAEHPDDWRNRFHLGFNHFFYLDDAARAAEVLEGAIALEGAPAYLSRLVARLKADSGELEVAAAFLQELARGAEDPYVRADYEKALDEIETERRARFLDAARERYRERRGRDIERVEDLVSGPEPVLAALPPELHGFEWRLDAESGRIVSDYYGYRYEPRIHPLDRARREQWRAQRGAGSAEEQGGQR